jgi:CHAT domain-containing protein
MYPTIRITLRRTSSLYGEAELNTFDGRPKTTRPFRLPFDERELGQCLDGFVAAIRAGLDPPARPVGQRLYETIFPKGLFDDALKWALEKGSQAQSEVHLQLAFDTHKKSALLRSYPWELLHDESGYLHASRRAALSRYLSIDVPPSTLSIDGPINLLVLSPRPSESKAVSNALELVEPEAILHAVERSADPSRLSVDIHSRPTFQSFSDYLTTHQHAKSPHLLHFDGHGTYGRLCPDSTCRRFNPPELVHCRTCSRTLVNVDPVGYLVFYKPDGTEEFIAADAFAGLLIKAGVHLVVLSACSSAYADVSSELSSVAECLITAEVPAVVAMQPPIPVDAALGFVHQFYLSLAQFDPIGEAVARGRAAMLREVEEILQDEEK